MGNPIFSDFLPIFNIKRQWGTRVDSGVLGGEKPNIKQIVKKNVQKISKIGEIEKKIGKIKFFFLPKMV